MGGSLDSTISDYDVTVPSEVVSEGRQAFRDLYIAYDSLDFTAFSVPQEFDHCRTSSAEGALRLELSFDDTLDSVPKPFVSIVLLNVDDMFRAKRTSRYLQYQQN